MQKVPITVRALEQRLKRRHARDGEAFHVTRSTRWYSDLGHWHTITDNNFVGAAWRDLEALIEHARDQGVLSHTRRWRRDAPRARVSTSSTRDCAEPDPGHMRLSMQQMMFASPVHAP
ncbi:MAG: hypothetical protein JWO36_6639 [Myxococcales bacterium]|nr:hypothetical protein [Myxococcales bacterium]